MPPLRRNQPACQRVVIRAGFSQHPTGRQPVGFNFQNRADLDLLEFPALQCHVPALVPIVPVGQFD